MKTTAFVLAFFLLGSASTFAQTSQIGLLFGGSQALSSDAIGGRGFRLSNHVKEAFFAYRIEEATLFKIRGGEIKAPVTFPDAQGGRNNFQQGSIAHVDAIIDYRFSEIWGQTGLFAGIGGYRQRHDTFEETKPGITAGVNGDFPMNRRFGIVTEASYHWVNFRYHARYVTATGGVRFSF
jgi:hypothetical protein